MTWNATHASHMVHMASHGYRFTHDVQDTDRNGNGNNNVNATGRYVTQLPSPSYDRDPGGTCLRHPEGEITSESASFPVSGRYYLSQIEFSHWYCTTGSAGTNWYWDSSGDELTETAQISQRGCAVCDKWDAAQGLADKTMGYLSYPSDTTPSGALTAADDQATEGAVTVAGATVANPAYRARRRASDGQVTLVADLAAGLNAYREEAASRAATTVRDGRSRGILTFARPVGFDVVVVLEDGGVEFETIEAVSTAEHGERWSLGGPRESATEAWLESEASARGEQLLGVVSAQVIVDEHALRNAAADDAVFLVDLSLEDYGRGHRADKDVSMNDLYWALAGWD